ncbi:hypothetical protein MMC25_005486 [Agyrium rufum]|nr:hypothetical protein [Agyrium rufum]
MENNFQDPQTPIRLPKPSDPSLPSLPKIAPDLPFISLVRILYAHLNTLIQTSHSFEQLRTGSSSRLLWSAVQSLSTSCHHSQIVSALLVLRWHYGDIDVDDRRLHETRGNACEIVAWRFCTRLSEADLIDILLGEVPIPVGRNEPLRGSSGGDHAMQLDDGTNGSGRDTGKHDERSPLLRDQTKRNDIKQSQTSQSRPREAGATAQDDTIGEEEQEEEEEEDPTLPFAGMNALQIATVAEAKKFMSQRVIQKTVDGIWSGDIVFWDSLNSNTKKKPQLYNKRRSDPYSRLRVPKYQKIFEALFLLAFLALYYAVLLTHTAPSTVTVSEILLYIWLFSYAYAEINEFLDAGTLFYAADFWSYSDVLIIGIGLAFLIARVIGLSTGNDRTIAISFDILSLEALFLVPRVCALLFSLNTYFGTLLPSLSAMGRDFVKFLGVVIILYVGFLTTFTLLAREHFTLSQMSWILIKVFFGSSYLGFDVAGEISPALGPPLMLVFVCLTNILLVTSLISLLSNTLTQVLDHAREEYLFQYSVFVLEAAASSRRLTYFLPPLNLLPLLLIRPLRLCGMSSERVRGARIWLLKITHAPFVAAIQGYEAATRYFQDGSDTWTTKTSTKGRTASRGHYSKGGLGEGLWTRQDRMMDASLGGGGENGMSGTRPPSGAWPGLDFEDVDRFRGPVLESEGSTPVPKAESKDGKEDPETKRGGPKAKLVRAPSSGTGEGGSSDDKADNETRVQQGGDGAGTKVEDELRALRMMIGDLNRKLDYLVQAQEEKETDEEGKEEGDEAE